jgi:peptidoglycan-associated lipoprotein
MKTKSINMLSSLLLAVLLSACSSSKPQTISTDIIEDRTIQPGSPNDFQANVGDRVYFDFDKSDLSQEAQAILSAQAQWLNKYPQYDVKIDGKCDERGTTAHNMALGQRRSNAVKKFLIEKGVAKHRLNAFSSGKEHPLCMGNDEASWAKNRVGISLLARDGKEVGGTSELEAIALIKDGNVIPVVNPAA